MAISNPFKHVTVVNANIEAIEAACDRLLRAELQRRDLQHISSAFRFDIPGQMYDVEIVALRIRYTSAGWHNVTVTNQTIETEDGVPARYVRIMLFATSA
jgi:hypothetical protein